MQIQTRTNPKNGKLSLKFSLKSAHIGSSIKHFSKLKIYFEKFLDFLCRILGIDEQSQSFLDLPPSPPSKNTVSSQFFKKQKQKIKIITIISFLGLKFQCYFALQLDTNKVQRPKGLFQFYHCKVFFQYCDPMDYLATTSDFIPF